ncbi:T9SS type A sorting domain-containing protein [Brumimicrobium aurantiacum]|uniref:T9SS C-terminal target domain-containing protein n=1 Tax=Brumimicrobium aurantiacum TaxID=1737063 RepID=A0A3E1EUC6_9FLAO|nr:T9SS type A sorting domain-containing protein [Brumimicrobium aurantiacum]RFC53112.1 T9SS C-terminal target domain-containing protein [Brumimicrobium aurantiacum]
MKQFALLMSMLISLGLNAQNWAPVGAEWYYSEIPVQQEGVTFSKIEVEKDTIVNGQQCSKIIGNFQCPWSGPQFTYESNDTIYFYNSEVDTFQFLFDIGASPGDTWEINYIPTSISTDTAKFIVDSVGQTNTAGETLRIVHITQMNVNDVNFGFYGPIIERVGAPQLLTNYFNCHPEGQIRCYSDQLINYHKDTSIPCDYSTVGLTEEAKSNINIYPNPVNNALKISSNFEKKYTYEIYNLIGEKVSFGGVLNNQIDVSSLEYGTYLLKLNDGLEEFSVIKFMKR